MKSTTKNKIIETAVRVKKFVDKSAVTCGAPTTTACVTAISAFAEDVATSPSTGSLTSALSGIDTGVVLNGFYEVLPLGLTVALPIVAAKVGLNFFFGLIKGA